MNGERGQLSLRDSDIIKRGEGEEKKNRRDLWLVLKRSKNIRERASSVSLTHKIMVGRFPNFLKVPFSSVQRL